MYSHGKPKIPVSQKDFYMNFLDWHQPLI
jgi:hypothetical protein